MTEPAKCRWCGEPMHGGDALPREYAHSDAHLDPAICQALLLRKLVEFFEHEKALSEGRVL